MKKLRLALVQLWNFPRKDKMTGGTASGMNYFKNNLMTVKNVECDKIFFHNKKMPSTCYQDYIVLNKDDVSKLNKYDFIIFDTCGNFYDYKDDGTNLKFYEKLLSKLEINYAVRMHDEEETKRLKYISMFTKNSNCALMLPITIGIMKRLALKEYLSGKEYMVYTSYPHKEIKIMNFKDFKKKEKLIVTSCRMTTRKRILELIEISKKIGLSGYKIELHGADVEWFYVKKITENKNKYWSYHGTYDINELDNFLTKSLLHYNFVYLKRDKFIPRIEIANVEASIRNCLQIMCSESTPSWVDDDMAILINKDDLSILPNILKDLTYKEAYKKVNNFIEAFNSKFKDMDKRLIRKIKELI